MKKIGFLVSENYDENIKTATTFKEEFSLLAPHFANEGVELVKVL